MFPLIEVDTVFKSKNTELKFQSNTSQRKRQCFTYLNWNTGSGLESFGHVYSASFSPGRSIGASSLDDTE